MIIDEEKQKDEILTMCFYYNLEVLKILSFYIDNLPKTESQKRKNCYFNYEVFTYF